MKTKLTTLLLSLGVMLAFSSCNSCSGEQQNQQSTDELVEVEVTSEKLVPAALLGTFKGTVPCADCPGIEVELEIEDDLTYELSEKYLERDQEFKSEGTVEVADNEIITLVDKNDGTRRHYKLTEDGKLLTLGADQNEPLSELRDQYLLAK